MASNKELTKSLGNLSLAASSALPRKLLPGRSTLAKSSRSFAESIKSRKSLVGRLSANSLGKSNVFEAGDLRRTQTLHPEDNVDSEELIDMLIILTGVETPGEMFRAVERVMTTGSPSAPFMRASSMRRKSAVPEGVLLKRKEAIAQQQDSKFDDMEAMEAALEKEIQLKEAAMQECKDAKSALAFARRKQEELQEEVDLLRQRSSRLTRNESLFLNSPRNAPLRKKKGNRNLEKVLSKSFDHLMEEDGDKVHDSTGGLNKSFAAFAIPPPKPKTNPLGVAHKFLRAAAEAKALRLEVELQKKDEEVSKLVEQITGLQETVKNLQEENKEQTSRLHRHRRSTMGSVFGRGLHFLLEERRSSATSSLISTSRSPVSSPGRRSAASELGHALRTTNLRPVKSAQTLSSEHTSHAVSLKELAVSSASEAVKEKERRNSAASSSSERSQGLSPHHTQTDADTQTIEAVLTSEEEQALRKQLDEKEADVVTLREAIERKKGDLVAALKEKETLVKREQDRFSALKVRHVEEKERMAIEWEAERQTLRDRVMAEMLTVKGCQAFADKVKTKILELQNAVVSLHEESHSLRQKLAVELSKEKVGTVESLTKLSLQSVYANALENAARTELEQTLSEFSATSREELKKAAEAAKVLEEREADILTLKAALERKEQEATAAKEAKKMLEQREQERLSALRQKHAEEKQRMTAEWDIERETLRDRIMAEMLTAAGCAEFAKKVKGKISDLQRATIGLQEESDILRRKLATELSKEMAASVESVARLTLGAVYSNATQQRLLEELQNKEKAMEDASAMIEALHAREREAEAGEMEAIVKEEVDRIMREEAAAVNLELVETLTAKAERLEKELELLKTAEEEREAQQGAARMYSSSLESAVSEVTAENLALRTELEQMAASLMEAKKLIKKLQRELRAREEEADSDHQDDLCSFAPFRHFGGRVTFSQFARRRPGQIQMNSKQTEKERVTTGLGWWMSPMMSIRQRGA